MAAGVRIWELGVKGGCGCAKRGAASRLAGLKVFHGFCGRAVRRRNFSRTPRLDEIPVLGGQAGLDWIIANVLHTARHLGGG